MHKSRSLTFDALETKQLLSTTHATAHHVKIPDTPINLTGTLTVDVAKMSETTNVDSSVTTTLPVTGKLGNLGTFHGTWYETVDAYGDYEGPDEIELSNGKGTIVLAFSNAKAGKAYQSGPKSYYYEHNQVLTEGTRAYKKSSESGTIDLNTNASKSSIESVSIITS